MGRPICLDMSKGNKKILYHILRRRTGIDRR